MQLHFETSDLDFPELRSMQDDLARILSLVDESIGHFYEAALGGFASRKQSAGSPPLSLAVSSTATCIELLHDTGLLKAPHWEGRLEQMRQALLDSSFQSSGLPKGNPYSISFGLIGVKRLNEALGDESDKEDWLREQLDYLKEMLLTEGAARIDSFPPTVFLTERTMRALEAWGAADEKTTRAVAAWTWNRLYEEIALVTSKSQEGDVMELAYAALLAVRLEGDIERLAPQQRHIVGFALDQFFEAQNPSTGLWPRSRPQFVYGNAGNVHCFDYELLSALLAERKLWPMVFARLGELRSAELRLDGARFAAGYHGVGWASDHHGRSSSAESWATACVFQYCMELAGLVAEALRRHAFDYLEVEYSEPDRSRALGTAAFDRFLDAPVTIDGTRQSLRTVVEDHFLAPISAAQPLLAGHDPLPSTVPTSAILFGPPGTSKTQLARIVADYLGWPLLKLDPSHLMRRGRAALHAETNMVFRLLETCDEIVVLLDEFDELVRDRDQPGEMESRFLTTAMLPKLAALSDRRRIVYLLATNHLEQFDAAIRRPGRFDMVVPVMPPALDSKSATWRLFGEGLSSLQSKLTKQQFEEFKLLVEDLTYSEAESVAHLVDGGLDFGEALERMTTQATLRQVLPGDVGATWKQRIESQAPKVRIPAIVATAQPAAQP